jgi:hypothetical protein
LGGVSLLDRCGSDRTQFESAEFGGKEGTVKVQSAVATLADYAPSMALFLFLLLRCAAAHRAARLHALSAARAIRVIEAEFV